MLKILQPTTTIRKLKNNTCLDCPLINKIVFFYPLLLFLYCLLLACLHFTVLTSWWLMINYANPNNNDFSFNQPTIPITIQNIKKISEIGSLLSFRQAPLLVFSAELSQFLDQSQTQYNWQWCWLSSPANNSNEVINPNTQNNTEKKFVPINCQQWNQEVIDLLKNFHQLITQIWPNSLKKPQKQTCQLILGDLIAILENISQAPNHRIMILLQNNQELRPGGGFLGQMAEWNWSSGQAEKPIFWDIYQISGQRKKFFTAPLEVSQYLSEGGSWEIQDANWDISFPNNVKQIEEFLIDAQLNLADTYLAINLSLVEKILSIIGEVYIQNTQTTVNAENLAIEARLERKYFFPGSLQKATFAKEFWQALIEKIKRTPTAKFKQLLSTIIQAGLEKDWQIYSSDPKLQAIWQRWSVSGEYLPTATTQITNNLANLLAILNQQESLSYNNNQDTNNLLPIPLTLIEANVGINKVNQKVTREYRLDCHDQELKVNLQLNNQSENMINPQTNPHLKQSIHNGYVSILKILTTNQLNLINLLVNFQPQPLPKITTYPNPWSITLIEHSILLLTPPQQTVNLTLIFKTEKPCQQISLWWWKQSGIDPYPLLTNKTTTLINRDSIIVLE